MRPERRLPALSLLPGQSPAQAVRLWTLGKTLVGSGPSSARMAWALQRAHARQRLQHVQRAPVVGERSFHAPVEFLDPLGDGVEVLQQPAQAPQRMRLQLGLQHARQPVGLGPHVRGEAAQDALRAVALHQPVEHDPPVAAEQVREDAADTQALAVQRLLNAVADARAVGHDLAAVAAHLPQRAEVGRRDVAGLRQSQLADAGQPQAVGDVRLAALDLLHMLGMHQLGPDPGRFQGPVRCLPVHAGPFHGGRRHAVPAQPACQLGQARRVAGEDAHGGEGRAVGDGQAHAGGDLHLVHVETGSARLDDQQLVARHAVGLEGLILGHGSCCTLSLGGSGTARTRYSTPAAVAGLFLLCVHAPARGRARFGAQRGTDRSV